MRGADRTSDSPFDGISGDCRACGRN